MVSRRRALRNDSNTWESNMKTFKYISWEFKERHKRGGTLLGARGPGQKMNIIGQQIMTLILMGSYFYLWNSDT